MFKKRLQRGEGMLHYCIEGERVGDDGRKIVDVDCHPDPCLGSAPAPPGERGREPPSFFFFLGLPPGWEESSPSGPWPPWRRRGGSPSEIGSVSLSLSLFSSVSRSYFSGRKPFLKYPEIRNSDCTEILTRFFPDISFLAPEVELQPTFEEGTTHHRVPGASGAPWCLVGLHLR